MLLLYLKTEISPRCTVYESGAVWVFHNACSFSTLSTESQVCQLSGLALYLHMSIVDHREIQIVYNTDTGHRRPCGGHFVTPHTVRGCPASLSQWANDRPMCYQFSNF